MSRHMQYTSSLYRCVWIPAAFHDFSEAVLLLLLWSHPEQQFVPVQGCLFQRAQTVVQGVTTVTGEELLTEVMEGNRYPDTSVKTASKPVLQQNHATEESEAKSICSLMCHD